MNHSDFQIGGEFWTATGAWRCTDVGTRTAVAIKLDPDDSSWYSGPPYAVAENVFDENDMAGCYPSKEARDSEIDPQEAGPDNFELKTAFLAALEKSANLEGGTLTNPGVQTLTDRERVITAGAIRYFTALFYQQLGQLDPADPQVWEYVMDELADVSNCEKGRRTQRDYVAEILREPGVVIASGEDT